MYLYLCDTLTSNDNPFGGHARVLISNQPIKYEPTKS